MIYGFRNPLDDEFLDGGAADALLPRSARDAAVSSGPGGTGAADLAISNT